MICSSCGKKNQQGDRICCYCSAVLDPKLDRLIEEILLGKKNPDFLRKRVQIEAPELPLDAIEIIPLVEEVEEEVLPLLQ